MSGNKKNFINIVHVFRDYPNRLSLIKKTIRQELNNGFDINSKYLKGKTLGHYVVKYTGEDKAGNAVEEPKLPTSISPISAISPPSTGVSCIMLSPGNRVLATISMPL